MNLQKQRNKTMKLVLKNFSQINPNISFDTSNGYITTCSPQNTILARYNLDQAEMENFGGIEFNIYDFPQFLGALYMLGDEINITEESDGKSCRLQNKNGTESIKYQFSEKTLLKIPSKHSLEITDVLAEFDLEGSTILHMNKLSGVMQSTHFSFSGKKENKTQTFSAVAPEANVENAVDIEISSNSPNKSSYEVYIARETFVPIADDYTVKIGENMIELTSKDGKLQYWFATSTV